MKAFLDTSVLVATFYAQHEHHMPSIDLFLRFDKNDACCAVHSLAEIYSILTGRTGRDRVSGDGALLFLGNVRERLTTIALDPEEYFAALEVSAPLGHCRRRDLRCHAGLLRDEGRGSKHLYLERERFPAPRSCHRGAREDSLAIAGTDRGANCRSRRRLPRTPESAVRSASPPRAKIHPARLHLSLI